MTDTTAFAALELEMWSRPDVARSYAKDFAVASEMAVPTLVAEVAAGPGRKIVDLCSGHGNVAAGLATTGAQVTGVDFSPAMIDLATQAVPGANFLQGDVMQLPFDSASFDGATMGFGMPHVPDPPAALVETRRVLKPGGRLAYSVWSPDQASVLAYVFSAIMEHGDADVILPAGPGATDFAMPENAFPALRAAGFEDFKVTQVDSYWLTNDPDSPLRFFRDGTARGGALLQPQPETNLNAIRAALRDKIRNAHGASAPWRLPLPSVVISARAV